MSGKASGIPRLGMSVASVGSRTSGIPRMTCSRIPITRKVLGAVNDVNAQISDSDSVSSDTKEDKITSQCVDMSKKRTSMKKHEESGNDSDQSFKTANPNKSEVIITKGKPTRLVPKVKREDDTIMRHNSQENMRPNSFGKVSACDRTEEQHIYTTFKDPAEDEGACGKENCDTSDRTSKTIIECVMKDRTSKSSFLLHLPAEDQETLEKTMKVRISEILIFHRSFLHSEISYWRMC